jgi:hypothetical protein
MTKNNPALSIPDSNDIEQTEYDVDLAIQKNICGKDGIDTNFLYVQALYRKALESYLFSALTISDFEKQINESELAFAPKTTSLSEPQEGSTWQFDFFYLLNTIHVEYLNASDIGILQSHIDDNKVDADDELLTLVKRTYPEVLRLNVKNFNTHLRLPNNTASVSNALLFGVSFAIQYDEEGNVADRENEQAKGDFIDSLIPEMERAFTEQLNHPVGVFRNL